MRVWGVVLFAAFLGNGCLYVWRAISELNAGDPAALDSALIAVLSLHIASLSVLVFVLWGDRF